MGVCSMEDRISIHRHLKIYSWAHQDAVSRSGGRVPAAKNYLTLA